MSLIRSLVKAFTFSDILPKISRQAMWEFLTLSKFIGPLYFLESEPASWPQCPHGINYPPIGSIIRQPKSKIPLLIIGYSGTYHAAIATQKLDWFKELEVAKLDPDRLNMLLLAHNDNIALDGNAVWVDLTKPFQVVGGCYDLHYLYQLPLPLAVE